MEDDRAYYERRLREELLLAGGDTDEGLRALHRRWAGLYRERLARLRRRRPATAAEQGRLTVGSASPARAGGDERGSA